MKIRQAVAIVLSAVLISIPAVAAANDGPGVTLTPVSVSRLYTLTDGQQSDGAAGYLGVGVYGEAEWNVQAGPLGSPSAEADDDPIAPLTDGWTLDGISSFAIAHSKMTDVGGWSTFDDNDTFELFINNQATQDPGGAYGPEGWGYSVSYLLITYDTAPTCGNSMGDPMTVTLDLDLSGTLYAGGANDEYLLDIGYALGTGLTDYNPVRDNAASDPNPGLDQFDAYHSWRSTGFSYVLPTHSDSLEFTGVIGDQVQVLIAVSSFSYSWWGYTWTDGTLDATITAVAEVSPVACVDIDIKPGSDPNSINTKSKGVIPVAILGSDSFDVANVDVTTLEFGPDRATPKHDLTDPIVYADHLQDVNNDQIEDLVSHYPTQETGISVGDPEACLTASLTGGGSILGCDSVRVKK